MRLISVFLLMTCLLFSCKEQDVIIEFNELPNGHWYYDSIQSLSINIPKKEIPYQLRTWIRYSTDYPFYNLYFNFRLKDKNGALLMEELVETELMDSKSGVPKGDALRPVYLLSQTVIPSLYFSDTGSFKVELQQFMREDTISGIHAVGLELLPLVTKKEE